MKKRNTVYCMRLQCSHVYIQNLEKRWEMTHKNKRNKIINTDEEEKYCILYAMTNVACVQTKSRKKYEKWHIKYIKL